MKKRILRSLYYAFAGIPTLYFAYFYYTGNVIYAWKVPYYICLALVIHVTLGIIIPNMTFMDEIIESGDAHNWQSRITDGALTLCVTLFVFLMLYLIGLYPPSFRI